MVSKAAEPPPVPAAGQKISFGTPGGGRGEGVVCGAPDERLRGTFYKVRLDSGRTATVRHDATVRAEP